MTFALSPFLQQPGFVPLWGSIAVTVIPVHRRYREHEECTVYDISEGDAMLLNSMFSGRVSREYELPYCRHRPYAR